MYKHHRNLCHLNRTYGFTIHSSTFSPCTHLPPVTHSLSRRKAVLWFSLTLHPGQHACCTFSSVWTSLGWRNLYWFPLRYLFPCSSRVSGMNTSSRTSATRKPIPELFSLRMHATRRMVSPVPTKLNTFPSPSRASARRKRENKKYSDCSTQSRPYVLFIRCPLMLCATLFFSDMKEYIRLCLIPWS